VNFVNEERGGKKKKLGKIDFLAQLDPRGCLFYQTPGEGEVP